MHRGVVQLHAFMTSILDEMVKFTTEPLHPQGTIVYKAV
jgi:hypothetical protein